MRIDAIRPFCVPLTAKTGPPMILIAYIEFGTAAWALLQVFSNRRSNLTVHLRAALNFYGHASKGKSQIEVA